MSYFHSKTLDAPLVFSGGKWILDVEHDEPFPECGGPVFVKATWQYPLPQTTTGSHPAAHWAQPRGAVGELLLGSECGF